MRGLSIALVMCACGNTPLQPSDASVDADADADASSDASLDAGSDAMPSGFTISGAALGIRSTVVLTLTTGVDSRNVAVNTDGSFQFPGSVPAGSSYQVTTATETCVVSSGSGTDVQANVATVQLFCDGVVELASVAFASGNPATLFSSVLTPAFDPGALVYTGTRPFFMDDPDLISVTPTAAYPAQPSITVYSDPTTSGQPSPPHALGALVTVQLQHPASLTRTYEFTLFPAKPSETSSIKAPTPDDNEAFSAVAISSDVLVVGALGRGGTGAAFVLRRGTTGWNVEQMLQPTAELAAWAGKAVAIDGEVLVIGAPMDAADDSGRAYVYRFNADSQTWILDGGGTLAAPSPTAGSACGQSVAISGSRIIIGCPGENGSGNRSNAGAVYMFRYDVITSAWVADGTFKGADADDELGVAVAISGTTALAGAHYEDDGAVADVGGVHVLVRGASSWSKQGATIRGDAAASSHFGAAVAISGDYAVVGAPGMIGSAYVFHRVLGVWSLDGPKLVPSLLAPETANFGGAVAIDGTHLVIGAPLQDSSLGDSGMVHAYRREQSGWTMSHALAADVPTVSKFGASVALDGEWFAVGAPDDSSVAPNSGAAHVFR